MGDGFLGDIVVDEVMLFIVFCNIVLNFVKLGVFSFFGKCLKIVNYLILVGIYVIYFKGYYNCLKGG